jgi:hypothetical protein
MIFTKGLREYEEEEAVRKFLFEKEKKENL